MQDDKISMVPVASVEVLVSHYVRIIKWLVITLVISLCLMFGSFAITYFCATEAVVTQDIDAEQMGDGSNIIGGGDVSYVTEGPHQNS